MVPDGEIGVDVDALEDPDFLDLHEILRINGFKFVLNHLGGIRSDPVGNVPGKVVGMEQLLGM